MAIKNLFKRSSVAAKVPLVGDLDYGELAINYTDGVIYYKNASNAIKRFIDSDLLDAKGYLTTQTSHADVLVDSDTDNSIVTDGSNADKIVVRDASGHTGVRYAYTFYTSMNHSVGSRDSDDTFYSSTDNFIRKNDAAGFRNSLGLGTAALVDILDEDTMTSDSPTAVPSQQSVKAYVDANAGGSVAIQPAAPTFSSGALWFNNDLGQLFIGYTDSDGTDNFIEAAPSGSNPVKSTGLASSTELIIYNSAGTPVKTLYGAGE